MQKLSDSKEVPNEAEKVAANIRSTISAKIGIVVKPTEFDVLFGRGKPYQDHPGNLRLHQLVKARKESYMKARRHEKTEIAYNIVEMIKQDYDYEDVVPQLANDDLPLDKQREYAYLFMVRAGYIRPGRTMWSEERSKMKRNISKVRERAYNAEFEEVINEGGNRNRINNRLEERENVVSIFILLLF